MKFFTSGAEDANGFAPSFTEKPKIIPNESGTLITMKCVCKAKPEPEVTWYRGQNKVAETAKIAIKSKKIDEDIYELTLEIKDPSGADGGTYRCHVKNEYGESNANLNLNIEAEPEPEGDGPTFIEKPRIISENNGKLVIMECKVKANPKPTIVWTRDGQILKETNRLKVIMTQDGDIYDIKLTLAEPELADSGLYRCNIKNDLGELNANLTLNIEIVPVIKDKPKIIKIVKKKTVVIECVVCSKFEPKCTWFKEEKAIKETTRHQVQIEQVKDGEYAVKLEIKDVKETDKGSYKLVAKNEKGEATSQTVELTELPVDDEKKVKPVIERKLTEQTVEEGRSFDLIISLKQVDKTVKVVWMKNNVTIRESSDISMSFDGTIARLSVSKSRTEHSATYKVTVTNEQGSDDSSAKITVKKGEDEKKKKEEEEKKKKELEEKKKKEEEEKKKKELEAKKKKEDKEAENVEVKNLKSRKKYKKTNFRT